MLAPQITIRDIPPSVSIETVVNKKIQKLQQFYKQINSCRVIIESPQKHKHQGKLYNVRVELTLPGKKQLVATRKNNQDIYVAIRDAFEVIKRQLGEHSHKRHGRIKRHNEAIRGHIVRLYPQEGYGFIQGADGTECYFSITNVTYPSFDQLAVGDTVAYTPQPLSEGWQAHHVTKGRHNNITEIY